MTARRILLLLGTLFALGAIAVPALGSEEEEMYDAETEEAIGGHIEYDLKGSERYLFIGSGFECKVDLVFTTEGKLNRIKSYEVKECEGTGIFKSCTVTSTESTDLPWTVDLSGGDIFVTDKTIDINLKNCGSTKFKVYFKKEEMTPDKLKGFGFMTASEEEDITEYGESEGSGESSAEFEVQGEAYGTYGIRE